MLIAVSESIACLRRSDLETLDLELVCIELNLVGSAKIFSNYSVQNPGLKS